MALLIADLAFEGALLDAAKLGVLAASSLSATAGLAFLAWLGRPPRPRRRLGLGPHDGRRPVSHEIREEGSQHD